MRAVLRALAEAARATGHWALDREVWADRLDERTHDLRMELGLPPDPDLEVRRWRRGHAP